MRTSLSEGQPLPPVEAAIEAELILLEEREVLKVMHKVVFCHGTTWEVFIDSKRDGGNAFNGLYFMDESQEQPALSVVWGLSETTVHECIDYECERHYFTTNIEWRQLNDDHEKQKIIPLLQAVGRPVEKIPVAVGLLSLVPEN